MKDNLKSKICNLTHFVQAVPVCLPRNYDFKVCLQHKYGINYKVNLITLEIFSCLKTQSVFIAKLH